MIEITIRVEPQPDGTTKMSIATPDDPLQALELLNVAMRQVIHKAAQQRQHAAPTIQVAPAAALGRLQGAR